MFQNLKVRLGLILGLTVLSLVALWFKPITLGLDDLQGLITNPAGWMLDHFYWNEPLLRLGFAPMHVLNQIAPELAASATRALFQLDRRLANGRRGHVFATIRRRAPGM